jgi:hypothetical protein
VAWTDLRRLEPLLVTIQGLLQKGLTVEEILWTFLSRGVQPLRQQEATVKVSPGPSCLVCPSFTRPGGTKINSQI